MGGGGAGGIGKYNYIGFFLFGRENRCHDNKMMLRDLTFTFLYIIRLFLILKNEKREKWYLFNLTDLSTKC